MRLAIIAGLLSVGLFAGCGGTLPESQDSEVTGQALPPCQQACLNEYNFCKRYATTPEELAACVEERSTCYGYCTQTVAPAAEVTEQQLPPCERACLSIYNRCLNRSTTPEDIQLCEDNLSMCEQGCSAGMAVERPVEALRPPPCEYACDLAYTYCRRNSPTPAQCAPEREDCYSMCPGPEAR